MFFFLFYFCQKLRIWNLEETPGCVWSCPGPSGDTSGIKHCKSLKNRTESLKTKFLVQSSTETLNMELRNKVPSRTQNQELTFETDEA